MTARQNVLLPMRLSSLGLRERRRRAGFLLDTLGIAHCADRTPDRMSGGEQQRVAIATALANQSKVLLADEPTGELDSSTARDVFSALRTANTELGVTVLVVTHDPAVSSEVRRTIAIRDGKTSSETIRHAATDERGTTTLHAREYATLDRAGRVQLPREMTRRLGMRNRVELQEEEEEEEPTTSASGRTRPPIRNGSNCRTLHRPLRATCTELAASGPGEIISVDASHRQRTHLTGSADGLVSGSAVSGRGAAAPAPRAELDWADRAVLAGRMNCVYAWGAMRRAEPRKPGSTAA